VLKISRKGETRNVEIILVNTPLRKRSLEIHPQSWDVNIETGSKKNLIGCGNVNSIKMVPNRVKWQAFLFIT
jgi:hypothetical protein